MSSNMFDEVTQQLWNDYFPYYVASVGIVLVTIFMFVRKLLIRDGVIYLREFIQVSCMLILSMIPLINSSAAFLILW